MPGVQARCFRCVSAAVAALCFAAAMAGEATQVSAVNLPDTVALSADDTLEFTLALPAIPRDGTATGPDVSVFALKAGEAAPAKDAAMSGRALVWPSPRPGEWLVQVRGLKAPEGKPGAADLLMRWKIPNAAAEVHEVRLPGAVVFKAEAADVVLLMDGSLSLGRNDPQRVRVEAARDFIDAARQTGSIGRIGIVQFDNKSRTVIALTPIQENFEKALSQLDERGQTDIDGGIRHALGVLSAGNDSAAGGSIILFTDGQQEPGIYGNAHAAAAKAGVAVHTQALGREADRALLKRIAAETGGTFSDAAKDKDLRLAYAAIASKISRTRPIRSAPLSAEPLAIPIDGSVRSLALTVSGERSGTLNVENTAQQKWQSPLQLRPEYFVEWPETGTWRVQFQEGARKGNAGAGTLDAAARTSLYPLIFRTDPQPLIPMGIDTDEPMLAVSLYENASAQLDAAVHATLIFDPDADVPTRTAPLFDDGAHGDGAKNDGIYGAYLPLLTDAGGAYPQNASGVVRVTASGKRDGVEFRRETEARFVMRRHEGPALVTSGPLDLGTRFSGERASAEFSLRVRGAGGALQLRQTPPIDSTVRDLSLAAALLKERPDALKARERKVLSFEVELPELLDAGTYGGTFELQLAGAELVRLPWKITVAAPTLLAPARVNLGSLQAGDKAPLTLQLKASGGRMSVYSAELLAEKNVEIKPRLFILRSEDRAGLLSRLWPLALNPLLKMSACTPVGTDVVLEFDVARDAPAGRIQRWVVLRGFGSRELARVRVEAEIQPRHLVVDAPRDFGRVEPGDALERELSWKWAQNGMRLPVDAQFKLIPDAAGAKLNASVSKPRILNDAAASRFSLPLPTGFKSGEIGGWVCIEAGPVLALRRWAATVVEPRLQIEPLNLDFGNLIQGQRKTLKISLKTDGARPISNTVSISKPVAKVRLPQVVIPSEALKITAARSEMKPGESAAVAVELTIPEDAQDGLYRSEIEVVSRLGSVAIPFSVTVVNEIDPAPFHVSPSTLVLRFDVRSKLPMDSIRIVSHRDEAIPLTLTLKPLKVSNGEAPLPIPAVFMAADSQSNAVQMLLTLPGREAIEGFIQAKPDAEAGQRCRLHVTGFGDEHIIEVLIERTTPPALAPKNDTPRVLGWIILLVILVAGMLAYLVNRWIRRAWLRYAFYSVLFHLAFLPWAMPRTTLMEVLPDGVQISLLEGEELLGGGLSDQQMRRLEALKTGGGGTDEPVTLARGEGLAGVEAQPKIPDLSAKDSAREGTPGVSALETARTVEAARAERGSAPTVRAAAAVNLDAPLVTDSLAAQEVVASAGPKADTPVARAVAMAPREHALPAAMAAPVRQAATALYDSALPSGTPNEAPREKTIAPILAAARALADAAADAPLDIGALPDAPASVAIPQVAVPKTATAASGAPAALQRLTSAPAIPIAPGGNDAAANRSIGAGPRSIATTDDLKINDSAGREAGPVGVVGLAVSARPAAGGSDAIDDPLDAGILIGGVSPNGVGDAKEIGGRAGVKPGMNATKGEGAARGGSALGGIGSGTGLGEQLAFARGGDGNAPGSGRGTSAAAGRGSGSALPGFGTGAASGSGTAAQAGGGTGSHYRSGGIGAGGEGDAPLSAGPVPGAIGGGGAVQGTPGGNAAGVPGGSGIGIARGGTALGMGLVPGGSGSELAFAGTVKRAGALSGSVIATGDHALGGGVQKAGGETIGTSGTARRPGFGADHGEGDAALGVDPLGPGGGGGKNVTGAATGGGSKGLGAKKGGGNEAGIAPGDGKNGRAVAATGGFGTGIGNGVGTGTGGGLGKGGFAGSLSGIPEGGGGGFSPGGRTPARKAGAALGPGVSSEQLEGNQSGRKGIAAAGGSPPHWRVTGEHYTGGLVRINVGLTRHGGDWNSSPTALHHLRGAFIERSGLPELEVNVKTLDLSDTKSLAACRMVLVTSNKPIAFTPAEIASMRAYIEAGGTLWVNDSSAGDYEGFDQVFRVDVPRILDGAKLVSLPLSHPFFNSCYDLSKGYKGFRVPPGDKYRQDYIEAAFIPDDKEKDGQRAAIIYTRNDYADGLEIDPRMNAGMKSLTDLTNAEMQEASLRFGINLIAYSMGPNAPKLPPPPESTAEFEKLYRYNGPALPVADDFSVANDQNNKPFWVAEKEWCNETQLWVLDEKPEKSKVLAVRFSSGAKHKAAVARQGAMDLSKSLALVFDLHSDLKSGCNIALLINTKGGRAYETRPVFSRPGWNRNLRFPLNLGDFKSSASKEPWKEYDTPLEPRDQVERVTVLIYNLTESGAVKIGPLRIQK